MFCDLSKKSQNIQINLNKEKTRDLLKIPNKSQKEVLEGAGIYTA